MTSSIQNLFSRFISNPLGTLNLPNIQVFQFSIVTLVVVAYVLGRIILSAIGRKYSTARVFIGPVFMILLVSYNYYFSYVTGISLKLGAILTVETLTVPVVVLIGLALGHRVARSDRVFLKKGNAYYRSSVSITFLWALSFLVKMGIVTFLPSLLVAVGLTFSVVLDLTTGLVMGEAIKIHGTYKQNFAVAPQPS